MNEAHSPMSYMGDEGPSSPKRKKMRQKYAPKACVSCRRSKLKCTGEVPCQRCVDNGKRCFYSEDQTAAEVLQNLSRPTPTPTTHTSMFSNSNGNGQAVSRLSAMPQKVSQRRPSDSSSIGMTMEQRMARMEAMMEALVQDRGLHFPPSASLEREESIGHRSESAFSMPLLDPIHPALDQMVQDPPEPIQQSLLLNGSVQQPGNTVLVRAMGEEQRLPFPKTARYEQYVAQFFGDIHLLHPCVDEGQFRLHMQRIVTDCAIVATDVHCLALCYIIFACCDAVSNTPSLLDIDGNDHPGWHWCQLANSLVDDKVLLGGYDDLTLIQYLLFQALYFTYTDLPALAYGAMRKTCTAVLQQNLHQQSMWTQIESEEVYKRICVVWNVVISDRTISLSCGRPASLTLGDLSVELPHEFHNRLSVQPQAEHPRHDSNRYLYQATLATQMACSLAHEVTIPGMRGSNSTEQLIMDCDLSSEGQIRTRAPVPESEILRAYLSLQRLEIPLVVGRKLMINLESDPYTAPHIVQSAVDHLRSMAKVRSEAVRFSPCCQMQASTIIAGILLSLGCFILQDVSRYVDLELLEKFYGCYVEDFMTATIVLNELAQSIPYAKRIQEDFATIIDLVTRIAERYDSRSTPGRAKFRFKSVKDLVPSNIMESFPYAASSPALTGRSGVLWLF